MVLQCEQNQVKSLLVETVSMLCKGALKFQSQMTIEGLIGITLDDNKVILISIQDSHHKQPPQSEPQGETKEKTSDPSAPPYKKVKRELFDDDKAHYSLKTASDSEFILDSDEESGADDTIFPSADFEQHVSYTKETESKHVNSRHDERRNENGNNSDQARLVHNNSSSKNRVKQASFPQTLVKASERLGHENAIVIKQEVTSGEDFNDLNHVLQADCDILPDTSNIANLERILTCSGALSNYPSVEGAAKSTYNAQSSHPPVPSMLFNTSGASSWDPGTFPTYSTQQFQGISQDSMNISGVDLNASSQLLPQVLNGQFAPIMRLQRSDKKPILYEILSECSICCNLHNLYRKWFPDNYDQMLKQCSGSTLRQRLSRARRRQMELAMCEHCSAKYASLRHS